MSKWISVEDRLPEEDAEILVWCGWQLTSIYDSEKYFYTIDEIDCIHHVTHWMPLPEPPMDNQDAQ